MTSNLTITLSDNRIITLEAPKGKHLKHIAGYVSSDDDQITASYKLVSILSTPKLTLEEIDELDMTDAVRLLNAVGTFQSLSAAAS